ncbi:MAG: hypothetical protein DWP92_05115 [Armatimonadetes bacterium]|nr:MAG: hypothetical protein DWP92_05115 [Armatimonadota bacterium]
MPPELRKKLGVAQRGPVPRSVRYGASIREVEDGIAESLPTAVGVLLELMKPDQDGKTRFAVARYMIDRMAGTPATAAVAPGADRGLPEELRSPKGVEALVHSALVSSASPATLERIKSALIDDLRARGEIIEGDVDLA